MDTLRHTVLTTCSGSVMVTCHHIIKISGRGAPYIRCGNLPPRYGNLPPRHGDLIPHVVKNTGHNTAGKAYASVAVARRRGIKPSSNFLVGRGICLIKLFSPLIKFKKKNYMAYSRDFPQFNMIYSITHKKL